MVNTAQRSSPGPRRSRALLRKALASPTPLSPRPIRSRVPVEVTAAFPVGSFRFCLSLRFLFYRRWLERIVAVAADAGPGADPRSTGGPVGAVVGGVVGLGVEVSVEVGEDSVALAVVAVSVVVVREGASDEQRRRATAPVISHPGRSGRVGQLRCRALRVPRSRACVAPPIGREPARDSRLCGCREAASLGPRFQP